MKEKKTFSHARKTFACSDLSLFFGVKSGLFFKQIEGKKRKKLEFQCKKGEKNVKTFKKLKKETIMWLFLKKGEKRREK